MSELIAEVRACQARLSAQGAPFELVEVEAGGAPARAYRHAPPHLPALLDAGRVHGAKEFMTYGAERWSFDRFFAAADALADRLHASWGLQPGERVAIAMRNRPEWAVAFVAVALLGAVPAPLNSFGQREELLAALEEIRPRLLFADEERLQRVAGGLSTLGCQAISVDAAQDCDGVYGFAALLEPGAPSRPRVAPAPEDPALILFTSGATSRAKGVLSSQRAVCQALYNIDYIGALAGMTSPRAVAALMRRGIAPATLTAVPLFHVSGLHAQLLASLRNGRRLVFMHRWSPERAIELIRDERITQFNGAPSMVMQLLADPRFGDPAWTGSLGGLGFGGAGLPQRVIDDVLARLPESMSGAGFGLTESNGVGAACSGALFAQHPRSAGLPTPIVEVRIVELDGTPASLGQPGEVCLRGVTVMQRYWGDTQATARALRDGWLHTGDVGFLDANGLLHIVDRIKDQINRNGEKIASAEVESCLLQHPAVAEAAVFAIPDERTGEAVAAVVSLRPGEVLAPEELQRHVAARLASYKVPTVVHVQNEALPRNPAGKLLKSTLKALFGPA
jgi:long-chain acyl-CoA synthetase